MGSGASTPDNGKFLKGTGAGTSSWEDLSSLGGTGGVDAATTPQTVSDTNYAFLSGSSLSLTITKTSTILMIGSAYLEDSTGSRVCFMRIAWNTGGTPTYGPDASATITLTTGNYFNINAFHLVTGITAGTYSIQLQGKVNAGQATYYAANVYAIAIPE